MATRIVIAIVAIILIIAAIVWINNSDDEAATPVLSVSAFNQTKGASATEVAANPEDMVAFTLNAENQSDEVIVGYIVEANISGITDKATLVDASGASYNSATDSLVWTPRDIQPRETISQNFTVRVNPLASGQVSGPMTIKFNNELAVSIQTDRVSGTATINPPVPNPTPGYIAPTAGVSEWLPVLLAGIITLVVVFRKRLVGITSQV